ncbi:MAG TPA: hypothetical protein VFI13_03995, partial [Gemmatimonadales bacterium]|nr:hypothetical protein [Gemmatimonadales bacterium]
MDMRRKAAALGLALVLGGAGCRNGRTTDGGSAGGLPETGELTPGAGQAAARRVADPVPAPAPPAGNGDAGRTPSERTIIGVARAASPAVVSVVQPGIGSGSGIIIRADGV